MKNYKDLIKYVTIWKFLMILLKYNQISIILGELSYQIPRKFETSCRITYDKFIYFYFHLPIFIVVLEKFAISYLFKIFDCQWLEVNYDQASPEVKYIFFLVWKSEWWYGWLFRVGIPLGKLENINHSFLKISPTF